MLGALGGSVTCCSTHRADGRGCADRASWEILDSIFDGFAGWESLDGPAGSEIPDGTRWSDAVEEIPAQDRSGSDITEAAAPDNGTLVETSELETAPLVDVPTPQDLVEPGEALTETPGQLDETDAADGVEM